MRLVSILMCGVMAAALAGCSDLEKEANVMFVEAANIVQAASNLDSVAKYKAYTDAKAKIDQLGAEEFKGTQASLKVASQEKIGGLSSSELSQEIERLSGTNAVCGSIRSQECISRIIGSSASEFGMGGNAERRLPSLLTRLELAGRTEEARKLFGEFAQKVGRPEIAAQIPRIVPELLRDDFKTLVPSLSTEERVLLYRRAMNLKDVQWDPRMKSDIMETILKGGNWVANPADALSMLDEISDPQKRANIAFAIMDDVSGLSGSEEEADFLRKLIALVSPDKQAEALAKIASKSKENFATILKVLPDEAAGMEVRKAVGLGSWNAADRLDFLLQLPPEILRNRTYQVIAAALENKDRREEVLKLLASLDGVSEANNPSMLLYPMARDVIEGTGDFSKLPELAHASLSSDGRTDMTMFLCGSAVPLAARSGQPGLVPAMIEPCMPIFALEGSLASSAWAALRDVTPAAKYASIDDMRAAFGKLENLPAYARDFDTIIHTLLIVGQTELAFELAMKPPSGPKGALFDSIYPHLMKVAISKDGGKPDVIWPILKETASDGPKNWLVPDEDLTEVGRAFLDKAVTSDADFIANDVTRLDRDYPHLGILQILTKERLLALARNATKPELKAAMLDALAARVRESDPQEMKEAVWALPEGKIDAAIRIATIEFGTSLATKTQ